MQHIGDCRPPGWKLASENSDLFPADVLRNTDSYYYFHQLANPAKVRKVGSCKLAS
jgi:hypothetical protein